MKGHTYSKRSICRPTIEVAALALPMLTNGIRNCSSRRIAAAERAMARTAGIRGHAIFGQRMGGAVGITIRPLSYSSGPAFAYAVQPSAEEDLRQFPGFGVAT